MKAARDLHAAESAVVAWREVLSRPSAAGFDITREPEARLIGGF